MVSMSKEQNNTVRIVQPEIDKRNGYIGEDQIFRSENDAGGERTYIPGPDVVMTEEQKTTLLEGLLQQ